MPACKNCNHNLHGNYCSHCGQKAGAGRLSIHEVVHEAVHSFTHADKGILKGYSLDFNVWPITRNIFLNRIPRRQ